MDNKWNEAGMVSFITISLVLFSAETANSGGLKCLRPPLVPKVHSSHPTLP